MATAKATGATFEQDRKQFWQNSSGTSISDDTSFGEASPWHLGEELGEGDSAVDAPT